MIRKNRSSSGTAVPPRIMLIAIGNELLNGETRETNLGWLIKFFTRRGGLVTRTATIADDFLAVESELQTAKKTGVDLVVTTGGLGPTDDDATMAAIARCIDSPLRTCDLALKMVKDRINDLAKYRSGVPVKMSKEQKSMSYMPLGGEPLWNPIGVAPGMKTFVNNMVLIVLPGVPSEMKGIVRITLKDFWKDFFDGVCYVRRNILLKGIPEAELAPFVRKVHALDPDVYIKTRLKVTGRMKPSMHADPSRNLRWHIVVHFSVIECTVNDGRNRLDRLVDSLVKDLEKDYKYPLHVDLNPGRI